MRKKLKLLKDKAGWYTQEPNSDCCTLIAALNTLKFYEKEINEKEIIELYKDMYYNKIGIGDQQLTALFSILGLYFQFGHFDLEYIKYMLDANIPLVVDTLIANHRTLGKFTHLVLITDYKIIKRKTYLFCCNGVKSGSGWVPWSKLKKVFYMYNEKKFCENICFAMTGIINKEV